MRQIGFPRNSGKRNLTIEKNASGPSAAAFFLLDGLGIDEPLRFGRAARLFALYSGQSADLQKPADVRTCGVENDCSFLRSEPAEMAVGHPTFSSGGFAGGGWVHFSGSVVFLAMEKMYYQTNCQHIGDSIT